MVIMRIASKSYEMTPVKVRRAIERSSSAPNRPPKISYSTSGLTHVASTSGTAVSARKRSTRCFIGIKILQNATYSCQMFQYLLRQMHTNKAYGKHPFGQANGLLEVGHFKSSLLQHQPSSFLRRVSR